MWHHPIGGEVKGYNPYWLRTGSARRAQEGHGGSDNGIHPKHRHSQQLWAGEIPSIESWVIMSPNTARASQLGGKVAWKWTQVDIWSATRFQTNGLNKFIGSIVYMDMKTSLFDFLQQFVTK
jgi:hypothetical protein